MAISKNQLWIEYSKAGVRDDTEQTQKIWLLMFILAHEEITPDNAKRVKKTVKELEESVVRAKKWLSQYKSPKLKEAH